MNMDPIHIDTIPAQLRWQNQPLTATVDTDKIQITAGPSTDLFSDPNGQMQAKNSPQLLFPVSGDFCLQVKILVQFASKFDAGALLIYENEQSWGKFCFEYSPNHQPMIVSVVTKDGFSDDCNSIVVEGNEVYLRVARIDRAFAFHYSFNGTYWELARFFTLNNKVEASVGFSAQSPTGEACQADFTEILFRPDRLGDIRSGE